MTINLDGNEHFDDRYGLHLGNLTVQAGVGTETVSGRVLSDASRDILGKPASSNFFSFGKNAGLGLEDCEKSGLNVLL